MMETQTNLSFPEKCHRLGYILGNIVIDVAFIEKLKEEKRNERKICWNYPVAMVKRKQ